MTDAGAPPEDGADGAELREPADDRSNRTCYRDERDHFERVEKALFWVRRSRAAKLLPDRFLTPLDYLIHVNMQYRNHREALAGFRWDEDGCSVPPNDHVGIPSLFIVELFTPSVKRNLDRATTRNRWDTNELRMFGRHHVPTLDEARSGDRWSWWNLGEVTRRGSDVFAGDAVRRRMPKEFDHVELKALQIGQGITAVMAKFDLNDAAISRLDAVWHRAYEPEMYWENGVESGHAR